MRCLSPFVFMLTLLCAAKSPVNAQSFTVGLNGNDIYFYYKDTNNNPLFTYRVGAGGDIAEFVSNTESNRELLPPGDYAGQVTDRVMQLVSYDDKNTLTPVAKGCPKSVMWNVNQAGTNDNILQATVNAVPASNNQQLDVYSVGDLQWLPCAREKGGPAFRGRVSVLTRYLLNSNGVLQIHRLAFMGRPEEETQGNFSPIAWIHPVHQDWLPFLANTAETGYFDSVAMSIKDGSLVSALQWPGTYIRQAASQTSGYAILYNSKTTPASTFVAVAYGTSQVPSSCNCAWQVLARSFLKPPSYGVLMAGPELLLTAPTSGLPARLLVQSDVFIYPGTTFDQNAAQLIGSLVTNVPAPVTYDLQQKLPPDIAPIVDTLRHNLNCQLTGPMRTDHLAPRISGSCSP